MLRKISSSGARLALVVIALCGFGAFLYFHPAVPRCTSPEDFGTAMAAMAAGGFGHRRSRRARAIAERDRYVVMTTDASAAMPRTVRKGPILTRVHGRRRLPEATPPGRLATSAGT